MIGKLKSSSGITFHSLHMITLQTNCMTVTANLHYKSVEEQEPKGGLTM